MDGIANVAKMQQTQMNSQETQSKVAQMQQVQVQQAEESVQATKKIDTKEKVQDVVDQLNKALSPMNTSLKFGVDTQDIFFVSVIDMETSKMIRRFPAEQAADFLPKMQEVTGILFDSKG
jgi:flagellar protein FlaG